MKGAAIFADDLPIWLSSFGSPFWRHVTPESPQYSGETTSSIVWNDFVHGRGATFGAPLSKAQARYALCLTNDICNDLRIAAYIYAYFPKILKDARNSKGAVHPRTVKGRIDELAKFFSFVIVESAKSGNGEIIRLQDISFQMLKEALKKYTPSQHLKRALKLISDPVVQKNLSGNLQWTLFDINGLSSLPASGDNNVIPTLSDSQFLFLLEYSKSSVFRFMRIAKLPIRDADVANYPWRESETALQNLQAATEEYYSSNRLSVTAGNFTGKYGATKGEVAEFAKDAHTSAIMLIFLLTGMRNSDSKYLMVGSLFEKHGYWFLKSKLVKNKAQSAPIADDWLAIDLVRDAYDLLCFFCRATGNRYLFSSPLLGEDSSHGYRGSALNTKFSRWISKIDSRKLFENRSFSVHQCRETLAFQLAKQEVGLTFISMQLKHFHSKFYNMPNDVTVGYGNFRNELLKTVSSRLALAREEALLDIYGEKAKFAGGGAGEHKTRIDTFFTGLGLYGAHREKYIRTMARRGAKLMPTSIGNCSKNFVSAEDAREPACYGDYQCDPSCSSHVITERSALALEVRRDQALIQAREEPTQEFKIVWLNLADKLDSHIKQHRKNWT